MIWSNPKKTREMKPWSVKNGTYRERFNFPTFLHETELLLRGDHPNIDSHWPKPSPKPRLETNDLERWNFHSDRYAGMPGQSGATQKSTDWEVRVICRHHLLWPFVYNGSWVNTQFSSSINANDFCWHVWRLCEMPLDFTQPWLRAPFRGDLLWSPLPQDAVEQHQSLKQRIHLALGCSSVAPLAGTWV